MADLQERLRYTAQVRGVHHYPDRDPIASEALEAADALDAAEAEIARLTAERDAAWNALAWLMAAYRLESPCPIEAITGSAEHLPTIERAISLEDTPCAHI